MQRSYLFTGGIPVLVLTTRGRRTHKPRSTPLAFLPWGNAFAVMASNAGNDRVPSWWLNLQDQPTAEIFVHRARYTVIARQATPAEDAAIWAEIAELNPGFDEYRQLTRRPIPVILLDPDVIHLPRQPGSNIAEGAHPNPGRSRRSSR